jgi:type VI secretion system protein ImpH
VRLGPIGYDDFQNFLPGRSRHIALSQIVRSFVGALFDFDLQLVLSSEDVPPCQLGGTAQLGWNTWLFSRPATADVSDAVFACGGWPTH